MAKPSAYRPTWIDGEPYLATLPNSRMRLGGDGVLSRLCYLPGEVQPALCRDRSQSNLFAIHQNGQPVGIPAASAAYSFSYRPVLIPLDPESSEIDKSRLDCISDGAIIELGTLYMGSEPILLENGQGSVLVSRVAGPTTGFFTETDTTLSLRNTSDVAGYRIRFIKYAGGLLAIRPLIQGVSSLDLARAKLVKMGCPVDM